jgi:hypothetical protein
VLENHDTPGKDPIFVASDAQGYITILKIIDKDVKSRTFAAYAD